jgi:protocatechuate 3,4-dioxygenase beta subunit
MKTIGTLIILLMLSLDACSQTAGTDREKTTEKMVGGPCEGCEAVLEFGDKPLTWIDTLPDFHEPGPKLVVSGTIYEHDGRTPAKGVILYVYHTDQKGEYSVKGNENGWGKLHGYIRGWIRTNANGWYKFYTLKPAAYPGGGNPAHIHPIIKEPRVQPYWIDEYVFDGDPYLTAVDQKRPPRGGSGILKTKTDKNGMLLGKRDIILGLNVPEYQYEDGGR